MIISDPDFATPVSHNWHFGASYGRPDDPAGLLYVHIPKNASTFTSEKLINTGFKLINYHKEQKYNNPSLVVLRDPLDRWFTGAVEYLVSQFSNPLKMPHNFQLNDFQALFENFEVDAHTCRQTKFLHGLNTDNIIFLKCDTNYQENLFKFCNENNILLSPRPGWRNASESISVKRQLKPLLLEKINQTKLVEYLQPDYKLIESVEFYDPA